MLIITRRPGERIMLGDDITIHVMEIVGNSARVGIEAPKSLPVYREEIWAAVKEENEASARGHIALVAAGTAAMIALLTVVPAVFELRTAPRTTDQPVIFRLRSELT